MKGNTVSRLKNMFISVVAVAFASPAVAQQYPERPIRFVVPFTPGGISDTLVRLVAEPLTRALGQQVVLDFRPGAGGKVGLEIAAKAGADGYTMFLGAQGTLAVMPSLYRQLPFNPDRDFAPVALLVRSRYLLLLNPAVPANNLKELIALIAAKPRQFSYASVGAGSTGHFAGEMFKRAAKIDAVHVPYKGETPAITGLIGGETQLMFSLPVAPGPHIKAGRIRPLAIASAQRSPLYPEVPTFEESGVPDFDFSTWFGMMTLTGVPPAVIARLNAETNRILKTEEVRARLLAIGLEPAVSTPQEFGAYIRTERVKWARVVRESGITVD
jgi:tripartite-type tricarboxylate transporter receptor subunit TctC